MEDEALSSVSDEVRLRDSGAERPTYYERSVAGSYGALTGFLMAAPLVFGEHSIKNAIGSLCIAGLSSPIAYGLWRKHLDPLPKARRGYLIRLAANSALVLGAGLVIGDCVGDSRNEIKNVRPFETGGYHGVVVETDQEKRAYAKIDDRFVPFEQIEERGLREEKGKYADLRRQILSGNATASQPAE